MVISSWEIADNDNNKEQIKRRERKKETERGRTSFPPPLHPFALARGRWRPCVAVSHMFASCGVLLHS